MNTFLHLVVSVPARRLAIFLEHHSVPPMLAHAVTLVLFLATVFLVTAPKVHLSLAGVFFYVACILGIASETLLHDSNSRVIQRLVINRIIRFGGYALFFCAAGIGAYTETGNSYYVVAVLFTAFLWVYYILLVARLTSSEIPYVRDLVTRENLRRTLERTKRSWERALLFLAPLAHSRVVPPAILILSIFSLYGFIFISGSVILAGAVVTVLNLLYYQDSEHAREIRESIRSFLFYLVGVSVLLFLVIRLPFSDVMEAVNLVGPEVIWLILFPAVWAVPYAMTLTVLLDNRIRFIDALYTQVSGDGFNGVTPLLGMGGEPYKAKHLSRFVPLQDSSRAIVQSRLIHALSGVLYTVIILTVCLLVVDLSGEPALKSGLIVVIAIMTAVTLLLLWVTMSPAPTRVTGYILSRFRLIDEFRHDPLSWVKLCKATFYRLLGRFARFVELYLIFLILNISPSFADIVIVQGLIMASVSVFFFVPQGIGVNEAGIVTAMNIAGYSAALGVVFGLIRRARMVVYTLIGLLVYLAGSYYYRK